jgi:hypothetical protein
VKSEVNSSEVWTYNVAGNSWTQISASNAPPLPRGHHVAVYDSLRDEMVVFGGGDFFQTFSCFPCATPSTYTYRNDTWSFYLNGVPPAKVTNLATAMIGKTTVCLSWTAPGDDENYGTASQYLLAYTQGAITEANFFSLPTASVDPPGPAGTSQIATVWGLTQCSQYNFALKTQDEVGNYSPLSNIRTVITKCSGPSFLCDVSGLISLGDGDGGESSSDLPAKLELLPPVPNPAGSSVVLRWLVPTTSLGQDLDVGVFDIAGRQVKRVSRGEAQAGRHEFAWDLRAEEGMRVRAGVYFLRLRLGGEQLTRTLRVAQ